MDPVVAAAFIAGAVGIVTGLLTLRATRVTEETKQKQIKNATELDTVRLRLESWSELVQSLREEISRLRKMLLIKDGKIEALEETIQVLREGFEDDGAPQEGTPKGHDHS